MNICKALYTGRPSDERSEVEMAIYDRLDYLGIDYQRADHDHDDTMEDCLAIEKVLGAKICKNLFLCNRQKTSFYMLLMPGDIRQEYLETAIRWIAARDGLDTIEEYMALHQHDDNANQICSGAFLYDNFQLRVSLLIP